MATARTDLRRHAYPKGIRPLDRDWMVLLFQRMVTEGEERKEIDPDATYECAIESFERLVDGSG